MGYIKSFILSISLLLFGSVAWAANVCDPVTGTNCQEVDSSALGGAGHTGLFAGNGDRLNPNETFRGAYAINVRQSATTAAGASTFCIWNGTAGKTIAIKQIGMQFFFDGTSAVTLMKYEWVKATGVTAFSGGATVTPLNKRTSMGAPASAVARVLDTGLTTTGASFGGQLGIWAAGRVPASATVQFTYTIVAINVDTVREWPIELAFQEALCLRQFATSVIGDNVIGTVMISEY
jgi:hypothetical protein